MSGPSPHHDRREHPRGHQPQHDDHVEEGWLVSYADMMTLLFGFFVILFSMSTLEKKKFEQMSAEMEKQFKEAQVPAASPQDIAPIHNAPEAKILAPPSPSEELAKALKDQILHAGMNTKEVEILEDPNGVTISLRGSTFFGSGQTELAPQGAAFVSEVGRTLRGLRTPFQARVEGHTDDSPINSPIFPSNWELSSARAAGVVRKLADMGIAPDHLVAAGYGSSRPLFPNRTAQGEALQENMSKNRRVVLYISMDEKRATSSAASATQAPAAPQSAPVAPPAARPQAMAPASATPAAAMAASAALVKASQAVAQAPAAPPIPAASAPAANRAPASVPAAVKTQAPAAKGVAPAAAAPVKAQALPAPVSGK